MKHLIYVNEATLIQLSKNQRGQDRQHVVQDSKHTFCVSVYYPVLDNMIGEIGKRFSNTNCNIMQGVQALNPSNFFERGGCSVTG